MPLVAATPQGGIPPQPIKPPGVNGGPPLAGALYCRSPVDASPRRLCTSPKGAVDPKRLVSLYFVVTGDEASQQAPNWYWKPGGGPYLFGDDNIAQTGDALSFDLIRDEYSIADPWMCTGPRCVTSPAPP